jgi:hypothetical protein
MKGLAGMAIGGLASPSVSPKMMLSGGSSLMSMSEQQMA